MELVPLSAALGVEVGGVDPAGDLDDATVAELRAAYDRHHLLLVRGREVDEAAQERFASLFGPLVDEMGDGQTSGPITNVDAGHAGAGELPFHSDLAFTAHPVQGISMCALEIPASGTTTSFADGVLAWRDLPAPLRARATGVRAWHALGAFELGSEGARSRGRALSGAAPRHAHGLPLVHPRTGEEVLYVTDLHVERLEGVDGADDPDALLDALLAHLYAPEHVYVHHWQVGDLLVWDNLALQHARPDVSTVGARTFRRNSLNTHRWIELVGAPPG